MVRSRWFEGATPRILAHRGFSAVSQENSRAAFAAAITAGAIYLESDIHVTADGIPVLMHDRSLHATGGENNDSEDVGNLTWDELRSRTRGDSPVMSLDAALKAFPDALWNLDLKVDAAVLPTVQILQKLQVADRVLIATFSGRRSRAFHQLMPDVPRSVPAWRLLAIIVYLTLGWQACAYRLLRGYEVVQLPMRWRGIPVLSHRVLRGFHTFGIEVHVWTVNDMAVARRLLDAGVAGIFTDEVSATIDLVNTLDEQRNLSRVPGFVEQNMNVLR